MFHFGDFLNLKLQDFMKQTPSLEEKLKDENYPLEDYLKDDEAISCIKLMGKNTKKYFNPEKIKKLIKLITEEPEEEDQLKGHKFPYIACEILKCDCPFISKRFVLNEQEYDEEYPDINNDDEKDDKEIDFDFYKNEFDSDCSKIEEKLNNLRKNRNLQNAKDNKTEENTEKNNKDSINGKEEEKENEEDENYEKLNDNDKIEKEEEENNILNDDDIINNERDEEKEKIINNEKNDENNTEEKIENINNNNNNLIEEEDKNNKDNNENKQKLDLENQEGEIKDNIINEKNPDEKRNNEKVEIKEDNGNIDIDNKNEEKGEIKEIKENELNEEKKIEKNDKENNSEIKPTEENENNNKDNIEEEKEKEENKEKISEENKNEDEKKEEKKEINNQNNEEKDINNVDEEKNEVNEDKEIENGNGNIEEKNEKEEKEINIKEDNNVQNYEKENEEVKKEEIENIDEKKDENNQEEKGIKKLEEQKVADNEKEKDINIDNNQEEEGNEEIDNIIVDTEGVEEVEEKEEKNNIENGNENNDEDEENKKKDDDSLSIEGEIEDFYPIKKKPKKKYDNKPNNEYLDLLLNFVMNDKPELNYVLSGYFANVLITLLTNYPSQIIKYLYTQRKDAIRKIIHHSNQKAFAILSLKILNIETYISSYKQNEDNNIKEIITSNINFRNELIGEIIKSINLEGMRGEGENSYDIDIEGKFALIMDMINENKNIVEYLIINNEVYSHIFDILNIDLYSIDNDNNFNTKYFIYGLFIVLVTKLIKSACLKGILISPSQALVNFINKEKDQLTFTENIIISLGKILKNNFLPKKPKLILEKGSSIPYKGLGILNIKIIELIKEIFSFMKDIPTQFDNILIRSNFWQKSIEYFFQYQWNNIYHIQFVELFNLYLLNEEKHNVLTDYLFNNLKFHEILVNYLNQENIEENENIIPKQRIIFNFKSGRTIKSGVYPHVIDLIYKIQSFGGLTIFTEEEKANLKIKNYGEFEFSKDEKSNKLIKLINKSNNINNILKDSKKWNDTTNTIVLPLIKKYEGQLYKEEEKKNSSDDNDNDNDNDDSDDLVDSNLKKRRVNARNLLQNLLNVIQGGNKVNKRFTLPISRNDKNNNKSKNEKSSIRVKFLNKDGYRNQRIFDDDEDEKNKDSNNNDLNKENNENDSEDNNKYNDTNYWEIKNGISDDLKKEVDKKTHIMFNYFPTDNDNKKEVSEEDELLSIAMELERNENLEKKKKLKLNLPNLPYRIKPYNLKTKTNPIQSIFSSPSNSNNNDDYKIKLTKKYNKNKNEDNVDILGEKEKEKDKEENINTGENEENEEEEEGVVKKEEKEENNEDKKEIDNKDENNTENKDINNNVKDKDNLEEKKENENNNYNDVNYWGSKMYLKENEMEDCLKDL